METIMITPKKSAWLGEGEHKVTIAKVEQESFGSGDKCLALTFADAKALEHRQFYPITGYRTWEPEGEDAKVPDAMTEEEQKSGMYQPEEGTKYVLQVAKKQGNKLVALPKPVRVVSAKKSAAALAIIERLAGAFGFEEGKAIDVAELEGMEGHITIRKVPTPDGPFNRVVSFRAVVANAEELA